MWNKYDSLQAFTRLRRPKDYSTRLLIPPALQTEIDYKLTLKFRAKIKA